jgi:hypothetical protein
MPHGVGLAGCANGLDDQAVWLYITLQNFEDPMLDTKQAGENAQDCAGGLDCAFKVHQSCWQAGSGARHASR